MKSSLPNAAVTRRRETTIGGHLTLRGQSLARRLSPDLAPLRLQMPRKMRGTKA